jgi:hypothetical protein
MNSSLHPARLFALFALLLTAAGCGDEAITLPDGGAAAPDAGAAGAEAGGDASSSDGLAPDGAPPAGPLYGDTPFSIVVLPDTQFYVQSYPETFVAETKWVADHKVDEKIAFVLHVGDIVETFTLQNQWDTANAALRIIETAGVPYVLAAGNHDTNLMNRQAVMMNKNFPPSRFAPALQATFEPDKIENAYYYLQAGGRTWVILSLEFGARDEVVAWAGQIAKANADKPAILLTHAYMYMGHERYDKASTGPMQYWNPHDYGMPGTTNDGQEMFRKMVSANDNILFVFSGHATWPEGATGLISTRRANGYYLHEMLSNYQGCPVDDMCMNRMTMKPVKGGEGMMRIMRVDPPHRSAHVETFSPLLMMSRQEPEHTFDLALE